MAEAIRLHTESGFVSALAGKRGRLYTEIVPVEFWGKSCKIRKRRVPNRDIDKYAKPLMKGKKPYPLTRLCNHLLRMGRHGHMTKGARALVNEAKEAA